MKLALVIIVVFICAFLLVRRLYSVKDSQTDEKSQQTGNNTSGDAGAEADE